MSDREPEHQRAVHDWLNRRVTWHPAPGQEVPAKSPRPPRRRHGPHRTPALAALAAKPPRYKRADAPRDPRVYFPGDTIPEGTVVENEWGGISRLSGSYHGVPRGRVYVEVAQRTPGEWQAIVDRARAARAEREET